MCGAAEGFPAKLAEIRLGSVEAGWTTPRSQSELRPRRACRVEMLSVECRICITSFCSPARLCAAMLASETASISELLAVFACATSWKCAASPVQREPKQKQQALHVTDTGP